MSKQFVESRGNTKDEKSPRGCKDFDGQKVGIKRKTRKRMNGDSLGGKLRRTTKTE